MGTFATLRNDIENGTPSVKEISRARLREIKIQIWITITSIVAIGILAYLVYRHII